MESILQISINSVVTGIVLTLIAYGFGIIFNVTKVFHIAHAGIYVTGVYIFLFISNLLANSIPVSNSILITAILITAVSIAVLAWLIEKLIYYPLYHKSSNQMISLISSLGLYIVFVNIIALLFGNETKVFTSETAGSISISNIIITSTQLIQIIIGLAIFVFIWLLFRMLNLEMKIRAVTDNSMIASVIGINVKKIRIIVLISGSLLAVAGALLKSYEVGIDPYSGMSVTLTAAVIVILAGTTRLIDIFLIAILISILQNFTEWYFSAQWKDAITFFLLLIVMLFRTEGILSYSIRKDYA